VPPPRRWVAAPEAAFVAHVVDEIGGWLTAAEGCFLYALAARGPAQGAIVEIGSNRGKSTILLARAAEIAGREMVHSIDPHRSGTEETFRANLARYGLADRVVAHVHLSQDFVAAWKAPIRLLFIDGDHSYDGVRSDYVDWGRHVVAGGIIALHDSFSWEGVRRVVEESILPANDVVLIGIVDSITAVRKVDLREGQRRTRHHALRAARALYLGAKKLPGGLRKRGRRLLYALSHPTADR
jgi:predicted O-methyltransferase YrrM